MQPHDILQALYASEINCRVESFWDGGWIGQLGDEMNGFPFAKVRGENFGECVNNLAAQACAVYPQSQLADRCQSVFLTQAPNS
jgi:hypothetical protein